MFVPGCMWQVMHWLVGIALVNDMLDRMARPFFGIIGSDVWLNPRLPAFAYAAEWTGERSLA